MRLGFFQVALVLLAGHLLNCFNNQAARAIIDRMMELHLRHLECPKMINVDSPAGGGKTFVLNLALAMFRGRGDVAIATATTGIAAMLLAGGGTAHSRFGIPVPVDASSVSNIKVKSARADIIRQSAVIIWDEVTMADKFAIECVDRLLREIMSNNDVPFGGKLIVFSGARVPLQDTIKGKSLSVRIL